MFLNGILWIFHHWFFQKFSYGFISAFFFPRSLQQFTLRFIHWSSTGFLKEFLLRFLQDSFKSSFCFHDLRNSVCNSSRYSFTNFIPGFFMYHSRNCIRNSSRLLPEFCSGMPLCIFPGIPSGIPSGIWLLIPKGVSWLIYLRFLLEFSFEIHSGILSRVLAEILLEIFSECLY